MMKIYNVFTGVIQLMILGHRIYNPSAVMICLQIFHIYPPKYSVGVFGHYISVSQVNYSEASMCYFNFLFGVIWMQNFGMISFNILKYLFK